MLRASLYIIIVLHLAVFFSCTEDPVKPQVPPQPPPPSPGRDTADYYNWRLIEISGDPYSMYAIDTGDIYIDISNRLYRYKEGHFKRIQLNFSFFSISRIHGFENTVLLGGHYGLNPIPTLLILRDGEIINTYFIPDLNGSISWVYPEANNKAWLGISSHNYVYHFENGNFKRYILDGTVNSTMVLKNSAGELFAFGRKYVYPGVLLLTYRLMNDTFKVLSVDSIDGSTEKLDWINSCGSDIIMGADGGVLHYFNGSSWIKHTRTPYFPLLRFGGNSKDSLIIFGRHQRGFIPQILVNGVWKIEENRFPQTQYTPQIYSDFISIVNGSVIFSIVGHLESYIVIGEPIKKEEHNQN